jgi:hypothetical protein
LMCASASGGKIKSSARRMMKKASALYLFDQVEDGRAAREKFMNWLDESGERSLVEGVPIYTRADLPRLIEQIHAIHSPVSA